MSDKKTVFEEVTADLLKDLISEDIDNPSPFAARILGSFQAELKAKVQLLRDGGKNEEEVRVAIMGEVEQEKLYTALFESSGWVAASYNKAYEKLKALGDIEGYGWGDLLTEIYEGETYLAEIFVRLVEEQEGVEITSAKQLQKITGITELNGNGEKPLTGTKAKEQAKKELEDLFIEAMQYRYFRALNNLLRSGAKYKDLLKFDPKDFNLPESWEYLSNSITKREAIQYAINEEYLLDEIKYSRPSLRPIARDLEAPYSEVMAAYRLNDI